MSLISHHPSNAEEEQPFAIKHDDVSELPRDDKQPTTKDRTGNMGAPSGGGTADISAVQKMTAATWGSILTSLLGMIRGTPTSIMVWA